MYAFSVTLDCSVEEAVDRLASALQKEKLGIVSDVNVQAIMKAKLGEDIPGYRILGACAPGLAKRAIEAEPEAGALLPCNVVVRDAGDGRSAIHFMDPEAVLSLSEHPEVRNVASEAKAVLSRVAAALAG